LQCPRVLSGPHLPHDGEFAVIPLPERDSRIPSDKVCVTRALPIDPQGKKRGQCPPYKL